jgi:hypothetical protein
VVGKVAGPILVLFCGSDSTCSTYSTSSPIFSWLVPQGGRRRLVADFALVAPVPTVDSIAEEVHLFQRQRLTGGGCRASGGRGDCDRLLECRGRPHADRLERMRER